MNQADTAWMLISTALVLLMTPALAFFYGGLVRSKNALNTMMMSNPAQLGIQGVAVLASIVYSGALTFVLLKLIGAVVPLRTDAEEESTGLDVTQHGEEAYVHAQGSGTLSMQH